MQEMPQQKLAVEEERTSKVNFPFLVKAVLGSVCPVYCFEESLILIFQNVFCFEILPPNGQLIGLPTSFHPFFCILLDSKTANRK
jgi:hypothetical protein